MAGRWLEEPGLGCSGWRSHHLLGTARGGDWKQAFLSGHVGLEGAKCPGKPAGSRRRMHPREESP